MRLRTGHNPNDWTEIGPGAARLSGHTGSSIHGELVRATENEKERQARYARDYKARKKAAEA